MRRLRLLLATAAVTLVAGCSGLGNGSTTDGFVHVDGGITQVEPDGRKDAPVIAGVDLDGAPLSSADFAGKTLVVNAWGSWCGPCRKEAAVFNEVATTYADRGVQFLGVNVRDKNAEARAFERTFATPYPSLDDNGAKSLVGFNKILPAQGIPTTWIIDADGRVAARIVVDGLTASTLSGLIDDAQKSTA